MDTAHLLPLKDRLLTTYLRSRLRGISRLWQGWKRIGGSPYIQVANQYGAVFHLNPENYIDSYVIRSGYYESEVLEAILPFLTPEAVFWDVGANFGLHAVTAKYLKPESRIICIEPAPLMLAKVQENCRLNRLDIEIINVALSEHSRFQTLYLAEGNPGMSTLKPWEKASYSSRITCYCESGDNLVQNQIIPQPTVIKLDIEGNELEALLGMKEILADDRLQAIIFEADSNLLEQKTDSIYRFLSKFDFNIGLLTRNEKTHHNLENFIATRINKLAN